ncbi:MAG TPA: TIGR02301 family protein [Methyloceanibacter sp.]|jgi:uncharacterized protein (TIGR02301 family)|nr:TIGR02301 family protein [Methyloceanibacter sp.]
MGQAKSGFLRLALAALCVAWACMTFAPVAEAQFFWWFDQPKKAAPKPRGVKPKPPGDDLPPIVPRESSAPPPPDDRPYDNKLMRLTEILGAVHYLRELCGAQEGQVWREQMKEILRNEGTTAVRRAKLVNSFNDGYRGYRRTYRTCTQSATLATTRFSAEGATIAASLAQGSTFANKGPPEAKGETEGEAPPANAGEAGAAPGQGAAADRGQTSGLGPASQAAAPAPGPSEPAEQPEPGDPAPAEAEPAD